MSDTDGAAATAEQEPAQPAPEGDQATPAKPATGAEVVPIRPGESGISLQQGQRWWTERQLVTLRNFYPQGEAPSDADLMNFLHICLTTGLDPFRKEIYYIGREDRKAAGGRRFTAQTGIDGFRHIAERTGEYGGKLMTQWCGEDGAWQDVWLSSKPPAAARVAVARRGFDHPFYGIAVYTEFVPLQAIWEGSAGNRRKKLGEDGQPLTKPMGLWEKMPSHMLAKCAEAQAIRSAFPRQLAALYVEEEMHQADAAAKMAAERDGQREALTDRPWARHTGVLLDPPTTVVDAEVVLPPRDAMLEELANQARLMDSTLAAWCRRWVAARKKNVEDATDRELWELATSRRDMVAQKAAEKGEQPVLAVPPGQAGAETPEPPAEAAEAATEPPGGESAPPAQEPGQRVVEAEVVATHAGMLHAYEDDADRPGECGFMGCQMAPGDPVHQRRVEGQESLL